MIRAALLVLLLAAISCESGGDPDAGVTGPTATSSPAAPDPLESPEILDRVLDEEAVLVMLNEYLDLYNAGDYIHASGFLSSRMEAECGGPTSLAFALSQNHRIEGIDYGAMSVRAWGPEEPTMADVATVETYGGDSYELDLGLAFVFERGEWKLDDLYPLGAGAFCAS